MQPILAGSKNLSPDFSVYKHFEQRPVIFLKFFRSYTNCWHFVSLTNNNNNIFKSNIQSINLPNVYFRNFSQLVLIFIDISLPPFLHFPLQFSQSFSPKFQFLSLYYYNRLKRNPLLVKVQNFGEHSCPLYI